MTPEINQTRVEELLQIIPNLFQEKANFEMLDIYLDANGNLWYRSDSIPSHVSHFTKLQCYYTLEVLNEALKRLEEEKYLVISTYQDNKFYIIKP